MKSPISYERKEVERQIQNSELHLHKLKYKKKIFILNIYYIKRKVHISSYFTCNFGLNMKYN